MSEDTRSNPCADRTLGRRGEDGVGTCHLPTPATTSPRGRPPSPRLPGLLLPRQVPDLAPLRLLLLLVR